MQLSWRCARLPPDQNLCSLQNIHHAASTITTNTSHSNTANPSALPVLLRPLDASHLCLEVSRHLLYLNTWRRQELFSISFLFKHKSVVFSLFFIPVQILDSTRPSFMSLWKEDEWKQMNNFGHFVMLIDSFPSVPVISCSDTRHIGEGWDFL